MGPNPTFDGRLFKEPVCEKRWEKSWHPAHHSSCLGCRGGCGLPAWPRHGQDPTKREKNLVVVAAQKPQSPWRSLGTRDGWLRRYSMHVLLNGSQCGGSSFLTVHRYIKFTDLVDDSTKMLT